VHKPNTFSVQREFSEPRKDYESGSEIDKCYLLKNCYYVETRKGDEEYLRDYLYVYSQCRGKLWSFDSIQEAAKVFSAELKYANKMMKRINADESRISIEQACSKLEDETRYLTIAAVAEYAYADFVELAFSIDTPQKQVAQYKKALVAAKKYPDNKNITFIVLFFPAKGAIKFYL